MKKIEITIEEETPDFASVRVSEDSKGCLKRIPIKSLVNLLSEGDEVALSHCGVPLNCLDMAFSGAGMFEVVQYVPADKFLVRYMDKKYYIPFPTLVFQIRVEQKKVVKTRVFSAMDTVPTKNSVLYHFPFGNVYYDGKICWGGNRLPEYEWPSDVNIPALFLSAPTNNDLWSTERCTVGKDCEPLLSKIYEYLTKKEIFPSKWLVNTAGTVGELITD